MNTASLDGIIVPIRNGGAQMAEQRVPNLEEMGEQEAHSFLTQLFSTLSPEEVYEANHPKDYVMEMPQSGELVRGRENRGSSRRLTLTRLPSGCAGCSSGMGCGSLRWSTTTAAGRFTPWR